MCFGICQDLLRVESLSSKLTMAPDVIGLLCPEIEYRWSTCRHKGVYTALSENKKANLPMYKCSSTDSESKPSKTFSIVLVVIEHPSMCKLQRSVSKVISRSRYKKIMKKMSLWALKKNWNYQNRKKNKALPRHFFSIIEIQDAEESVIRFPDMLRTSNRENSEGHSHIWKAT